MYCKTCSQTCSTYFTQAKVKCRPAYLWLSSKAVIVGTHLTEIGKKVAAYLLEKWKMLTAYTVAWAAIVLIISGTYSEGFTEGFEKLGKPLSIFLAIGIGLSAPLTLVLYGICQRHKQHLQSGWRLFRHAVLKHLDAVVSALFISFMVYLFSKTVEQLPRGVGVNTGAVMGNDLFVCMLTKQETFPSHYQMAEKTAQHTDDLKELRDRVANLEQRLLYEAPANGSDDE